MPAAMTSSPCTSIITFVSGYLPDASLNIATMTILQTTNAFAFMMTQGINVSASTRVGNSLGNGDKESAKLALDTCIVLAFIISIATSTILFSIRGWWPYLFTSDRQVVAKTKFLIVFLCIYVIADGVQSALTGVLKGAGKQKVGAPGMRLNQNNILIVI